MARLFICGDIVNGKAKEGFIGSKLASLIEDADYAIGNLEGPELSSGLTSSCPHQVSGTINYLKLIGFDMMLLANNHITELGADGLKHTIQTIEVSEMDHMGAGLSWDDAYRPLVKEIAGVRFGFVNVCEAQRGFYYTKKQEFGYAWMGYENLLYDIRALSQKVDHVIVFVHTGLEHYPIPLPEVRQFYRNICDAGACVVIGGHTHSPQGYEYYGDKFISYSLGNFYFPREDYSWKDENKSYSLSIVFDEKRIVEISPIFHTLSGSLVEIEDNAIQQINLNSLCEMLGDGYLKLADNMCIDAYRNKYNKLLAYVTCGEPDDCPRIEAIKRHIANIVFRKRTVISTKQNRQESMLLFFKNETRRDTCSRALMCLNDKTE